MTERAISLLCQHLAAENPLGPQHWQQRVGPHFNSGEMNPGEFP